MTYPESSRSPEHHTNIEPRRGDARRLGGSHTDGDAPGERAPSLSPLHFGWCGSGTPSPSNSRWRHSGGRVAAGVSKEPHTLARPLVRSVDAQILSIADAARRCASLRHCFAAGRSWRDGAARRGGGAGGMRYDAAEASTTYPSLRAVAGARSSNPPLPLPLAYVVAWLWRMTSILRSQMSLRTQRGSTPWRGQPERCVTTFQIRSSPFVRTNRQGTQPRRQGVTPGAGGGRVLKLYWYKKTDTSGASTRSFFNPR